MKRRKTILCTILVLLAVSLAGLFWWQRDNLKAIHAATQHTSAELEEKLEENQQMIQEAVKAAGEVTVGEISEEDRQAFRDGSMTQEELVERLTNCLMFHGRNTGKKMNAMKIVEQAFDIINLMTDKNPIQVLVEAVSNAGPREDSTRIGTSGVVRRQAVDVSPFRRVSFALSLITQGVSSTRENKR